jgi:hypothetical protein
LQVNRQLIDGGYWVDLPFIPSSCVYQVAIIDVAKIYAGAMVPNLNGATPAALDVVLFKLPTGKNESSDRGQCHSSATAVVTNPYGSPDERQAVLSVMNALGSLRRTGTLLVLDFMAHYEQIWAARSIDPEFF